MTESDFKKACIDLKILLFDCDGVFTDGGIILGNNEIELKSFSSKDGMGIVLWRKAGLACGCISGRSSKALERRATELGFDELHQSVKNKRFVIQEILARRKLSIKQAAYIGDDVNDLSILGHVGIFFAPNDANQEVLKRSDVVLSSPGGQGVVREAIDRILSCSGRLELLLAQIIG